MRFILFGCTAVVGMAMVGGACGGDSFAGGGGNGQGGSESTSTRGPSGTGDSSTTVTTDATTASSVGGAGGESGGGGLGGGDASGGRGAGGASTSAAGGGGASATGGGGGGSSGCRDASGEYTMIVATGAGCGDLDTSAPACARGIGPTCDYQLSSASVTGSSVNGTIDLQPDGTFSMAMILEGTVQRSGCDGSFSGDTLVIECGGIDPTKSQYCEVTLTRTADSCN